MKNLSRKPSARAFNRHTAEQGSVRSVLLPLICFALGLAISTFWIQRPSRPVHSRQPAPELSDATQQLLNHLPQTVNIHFHSILDSSAPAQLVAFSQRAEQLLSAYRQHAGDKIVLARFNSSTNADPNAAMYDGVRPFNL